MERDFCKYTPMPAEQKMAHTGSEEMIDQDFNRQLRYIRGMLDTLCAQKILSNATCMCLDVAINDLNILYRDAKYTVRCKCQKEENH